MSESMTMNSPRPYDQSSCDVSAPNLALGWLPKLLSVGATRTPSRMILEPVDVDASMPATLKAPPPGGPACEMTSVTSTDAPCTVYSHPP
jgi:hypothetical protein